MAEKISRRDFLKIAGIGGVTATVLTGCGSVPEIPIGEHTLAESQAYLRDEMQRNAKLTDLESYGVEKQRAFLGHAFNIWTKIHPNLTANGEKVTSQYLLDRTTIGGKKEIEVLMERDGMFNQGLVAEDVYGKNYQPNPNDPSLSILINQDAYFFKLKNLQNPQIRSQAPGLYDSVLQCFLYTIDHESYHLAAGQHDINPPQTFRTSRSTFTYGKELGLALKGVKKETGEELNHFGPTDELSVYTLQELNKKGFGEFYATHPQNYDIYQLNVLINLYKKLGYTKEDILLSRQNGNGTMILLDEIAKAISPQDSQSTKAQDQAFAFLVWFDTAIYNQAPAEELQAIVDSLGQPQYSKTDTEPVNSIAGVNPKLVSHRIYLET